MRRVIGFDCGGDPLVGTIDGATRSTGLLIVSGGNEIRSGAHRGMALLAARIAQTGFPVFRYDRRGIGDSAGLNRGYRSSREDLIAAAACFRATSPPLATLVALGNCDAATTLALFGRDAGIDRILLANPWTIDAPDALPPSAAIRARYATSLRRPSEWRRLITGGVDISKLYRGLRKISAPANETAMAQQAIMAISGWGHDARVILAEGDATALAFRAAARAAGADLRIETVDTASHSFAPAAASQALIMAVLTLLDDAQRDYSAASAISA
ncbi:MAG TPA: hydrolase 1, exosortase A system-associated [Sphingomonas sp.]|nr:hydrolase 1, exosortase A system-associated [Sphingomonas sp.]